MKIVVVVLGGIVGMVALLFAIGAAMPRDHRASSRIVVPSPIAEAWALVQDISALPGFWTDMTSVTRLADTAGMERWSEVMSQGTMTIVVTERLAPSRMVTDIVPEPGAPFGGQWIYELREVTGGTEITVTEAGWISVPPFRVIARGMGYHRTLDSYLRALGTKLGGTSPPEHVAGA